MSIETIKLRIALTMFFTCLLFPTFAQSSTNLDLSDAEKEHLSAKGRVTMCVDPDWMPYERIDEQGKHVGIAADFMSEFQKIIPVPIELVLTESWKESLEAAKSRQCDILSLLNESPQRREFLNFTDPYLTDSVVIVVKNDVFYLEGLESLSGRKLGIVEGYVYEEKIRKQYPEIKIIPVKSVGDALRKVSDGEIYATLDALFIITRHIQELGLSSLKIVGQTGLDNAFRVGVRKDDPILLSVFDKIIKNLDDETRNAILGRWYTVKFQHGTDWRVVWQVTGIAIIILCLLGNKTLLTRRFNRKLSEANELLLNKNQELDKRNIELRDEITQRKKAEEELRKREEKYQDLYENSPDMYVSVDAKTAKIVRCNETTLKVLGYTREEVMGRSIFDMYTPESVNYAKKTVFPKFQQTGEIRDEELQVMRKDGSAIPVNLNASAVYDTDGEIIQSRSVWRDVTDYKLAAKALKESEAQFRGAFENAAVGASMVGLRGRFLRVTRGLCEMTGYSVKELLSRTFSDVTHPDDIQIGMDYLKEMVDGELDYASFRKRYLHKDGHVVHLNISPSVIRGEDGSPRHFVALFQDITERTRVENALRESEEHFREFVMAQADPLQVLDTAGTILICNDASAEAHGSSVAELIGENAFDGMPAAVAAERRALLDRVISTKQAIMIEEEARGKLYETMLSPITNQSGEVVKIAIFPHDITRRKRAEEELRESEKYNRNILDTVDEGFIVVDRDYRILTANRSYCEQVSLPSNEVLGKHCYEVSHRLERPCYELGEDCAVQKVFATGKPHSAVHKHPGKEGQVLYVETKAFPVTDRSGQVTSAIETVNNITEKHLLQEERLKTQKLESIGTLAGGIAHDFNNLLQGVFGHISMARMSIDQKDKSLVMLEQAEKALHRTVSLTNQLLTFSKGGKPVKKLFPILPVVEDAARFALSGSSSEYELLPQSDLWLVDGDAGQIGQVIQNITLNADQSMPQGGKISFRVRNIAADSEMPAVLKNGEYVMISIQDNGHGISEEFRERIFDPYFTTKERGSGLGLATSYSIVRNHDGIIVVESQLGKGATFRIYLPAVLEKIQEQKPASAPTEVRSAKVLIMD
ncbi:MAG: PAS domain S-box protein, partial [Desulfuromonadales bacterium]|nr:PAS domain S-box protein [Desulfuromonadales bacterium]